MLLSRFLLYLLTLSVLLIFSSTFLMQLCCTSETGPSLRPVLVDHSIIQLKSTVKDDPVSDGPPKAGVILPVTSKGIDVGASDTFMEADSSGRERKLSCGPTQALLRVYMYDLPPEFHFGLLGWNAVGNQIWPNVGNSSSIPRYPGGLNWQHSIEYWLTLDILSSKIPTVVRPCTAVRVKNSSEADVIFVPFFSCLSYNKHSKPVGKEKIVVNRKLQERLVQFLVAQDEWKRLGGKDHLIVAHHPNSMFESRKKLSSAMFVLSDFGRYPAGVANVGKDIIAPYRHLVRTIPSDESPPFEGRPILAYFQGAIHRKDGGMIRLELFNLLKDEKDVHFTFGSVQQHGIGRVSQGMASSKFCLNIAGDTPSSNRLFDSIASHCIPVIISDQLELPFADVLNYSEFCIFVQAADAMKKGHLLRLLRGIERDRWTEMWERLKEVAYHFEFQYPSKRGDAVDMIWQAVSRKVSSKRLNLHKMDTYHRPESLTRVAE